MAINLRDIIFIADDILTSISVISICVMPHPYLHHRETSCQNKGNKVGADPLTESTIPTGSFTATPDVIFLVTVIALEAWGTRSAIHVEKHDNY